MPRRPRLIVEDWPLHVVHRGHNKQSIFRSDDDRWKYLHDLRKSKVASHTEIHAYVLMGNHVHLLVTPRNTDSIAQLFQSMGRRYARFFNDKYQRKGALWESRYKSCLIESDRYLLACYRYIEMNPVRAGIVNHPGAYPWSSYHHNARGRLNNIISEHKNYDALGSDPERRQFAYQRLFTLPSGHTELASLRDGINHTGYCGSDGFVRKILQRR